MSKDRSYKFYDLIHEIEYEIGSECYNGNIQNYGPGGDWAGEGRDFRYPVTFINDKGDKDKYRGRYPFTKKVNGDYVQGQLGNKRYNSAYYAFGANQLYILRGIKHALEHIEKKLGINFDKLLEDNGDNNKSR
ncbi:hypothetical protein [Shewanella cyperi]|uniref:Uncharacterized protein n=1 Tax=Shewanella cyperi TaxID=2814292 RepID=A0A975AIX3_9GAMM|nr:hypothetical protein [Shewanella cyperi]QSX28485.1 hypothetical protein JYB88_09200 [Shewanella cyperi]QSX39245.1 hypothetical protein JYB84_09195 [Shewanella cyperi]